LGRMNCPCRSRRSTGRENPNISIAGAAGSFQMAEAIVLREKLDSGEMTVDEYNRIIGNTPENPPPISRW